MAAERSRLELSESLQRDEADVRAALPNVRAAVLGRRGISIGAGHAREPFVRRAEEVGLIDVVRRSTGGTAVLHLEGDLLWSLVLPRALPIVGRDFVTAYPRLGSGVIAYLRKRGLNVRWSEPPRIRDEVCLLSSRGNVLTVEGKVLGGAAQHLTSRSLLHHGCLQYSLEPELVTKVFDLPSETVRDHLTSLTSLGLSGTPEEIAQGLHRSLSLALEEQGIAVADTPRDDRKPRDARPTSPLG